MNKRLFLFSSLLVLTLSGTTILNAVSGENESIREVGATFSFLLEKHEGHTLRFKHIPGVSRYVVYDDNDYRDEIVISPDTKDSDGYLYYTTEVVGKHNVYVKGFTDTSVIKSNTVAAVENEPIFDYSIGSPVKFHDDRDGTSGTYTVWKEDGTKEYVTQSDFNSSYIYSRNGMMDFTTTTIDNFKISNILSGIKGMGSNVLDLSNRFFDIETGSQWWWGGSFENSVCKRIMDAAWEIGMKCIVCDFQILTYSECDNGPDIARTRIANAEFKKAAKHPAFYGIELNDEPLPSTREGMEYSEIANAGRTVRAILETWNADSELSLLPEPYIHTDLASYNDIADGYFDNGADEYLQYLEDWVTGTGLNHLDFDYYTYTTYQYGVKKIGLTNYNYDSTKVIYDCINTIRERHPGIVISQTLTRSNDRSRNTLTYQDVFASSLLALSEGNNGYSTFVYYPSAYSYINSAVDENYQPTTTYTWAKAAYDQYEKITGLLDGYSLSTNSISDYKKTYLSKTYSGYGTDARTSTSTFTNSDGDTYTMVVNFNTSGSTTTSVAVENGKTYYVFGYNKDTSAQVGTGSSVTLNNGEAILIANSNESPLEEVAKNIDLGYRYTVEKNKLVANSDKFCVKLAIKTDLLENYSAYSSYGIYVQTSTKSHFFDKPECTLENDNTALYVIINLGSVLTNRNTTDVFTFKVCAVKSGSYVYSNSSITFSVSSLVKDLYNDTDTRGSVNDLYIFMSNNGLLD